jgi:hypothetical protein
MVTIHIYGLKLPTHRPTVQGLLQQLIVTQLAKKSAVFKESQNAQYIIHKSLPLDPILI